MRLSSADIRNYVAEQSKTAVVNRKSLPGSLLRKAVIDAGYNRVAQAKLLRLESKRAASRSASRSPANKLARTILKRGVDPRALRDKLGKSAIDNMGYMGYGSNNPKKAASRAMKAATVERAMRIADRTARVSRTAHQTAIDNFKKNAHLFGPGGQRIKSR